MGLSEKVDNYSTISHIFLSIGALAFVWILILFVVSENPLSIITDFDKLTLVFCVLLVFLVFGFFGFKKMRRKIKNLERETGLEIKPKIELNERNSLNTKKNIWVQLTMIFLIVCLICLIGIAMELFFYSDLVKIFSDFGLKSMLFSKKTEIICFVVLFILSFFGFLKGLGKIKENNRKTEL